MIIKISNSQEKGIITRYLNKKYNTNYPTEFTVDVGGYVVINEKNFTHYPTRRALRYSSDESKDITLFAEFVLNIFEELQHLEVIHEATLTAYHRARRECMELRSKSESRKQMFQQCFKL